jgi:hypothetical protein
MRRTRGHGGTARFRSESSRAPFFLWRRSSLLRIPSVSRPRIETRRRLRLTLVPVATAAGTPIPGHISAIVHSPSGAYGIGAAIARPALAKVPAGLRGTRVLRGRWMRPPERLRRTRARCVGAMPWVGVWLRYCCVRAWGVVMFPGYRPRVLPNNRLKRTAGDTIAAD